jgi:hypothetical protein
MMIIVIIGLHASLWFDVSFSVGRGYQSHSDLLVCEPPNSELT